MAVSCQNKTMHPAGIKFGLTNDLLQLRGDDVILSNRLLEGISAAARRQLHGKRIDASDLLENVINRGFHKVKLDYKNATRGEWVSFFVKIDLIVFDTMFVYAERAGIGYRIGRTFYFTRDFGSELYARKAVLAQASEEYGHTKVLFLSCYDAVVARCKKVIPEDARHADLLALCMWKAYDQIMMNMLFERFGSA